MDSTVAAALGAAVVAALNELRAQLRANQADRDRAERIAAAHRSDPTDPPPRRS